MNTLRPLLVSILIAVGALGAASVQAQSGPSTAEAARYQGLHAAAHAGDAARIAALAKSGADLNARDGNGRTPLHVATFAKQRAAVQALAKAGAKIDLLETTATTRSPSPRSRTTRTRCGCCCRSAPARSR